MREVAVLGIGLHQWGKFPGKTFIDLGEVAARSALRDAGIEWKDIQAMVSGAYLWGGGSGFVSGQTLSARLGETGIPIMNVANHCATATSAFRAAYLSVASGAYDNAMAVGLDMSPPGFFSSLSEEPTDIDFLRWKMMGLTNPGYWAMECRKRMERYGTTELHLAKAKAVASKFGSMNPLARYKKEFSVAEVLNSPMVADPLRLFMICATSDGAAAVVLTSLETARRHTVKPVVVAGVGLGSSIYGDPTLRLSFLSAPSKGEAPLVSESAAACKQAYQMAGAGPQDMDLVELPDNSSWHYLQYIETLGLCEPGGADRMLDEGQTQLGGKTPVNPSGGVASFGEAVTAQGLVQICELVWQLRGQCGARQVEGARIGLAQTYGQQGNSGTAILKV